MPTLPENALQILAQLLKLESRAGPPARTASLMPIKCQLGLDHEATLEIESTRVVVRCPVCVGGVVEYSYAQLDTLLRGARVMPLERSRWAAVVAAFKPVVVVVAPAGPTTNPAVPAKKLKKMDRMFALADRKGHKFYWSRQRKWVPDELAADGVTVKVEEHLVRSYYSMHNAYDFEHHTVQPRVPGQEPSDWYELCRKGRPCKLYVDCDFKRREGEVSTTDQQLQDRAMQLLDAGLERCGYGQYAGRDNWAISRACKGLKFSCHLVNVRLVFPSTKAVKWFVKSLGDDVDRPMFDLVPYGHNQNYRVPTAHKAYLVPKTQGRVQYERPLMVQEHAGQCFRDHLMSDEVLMPRDGDGEGPVFRRDFWYLVGREEVEVVRDYERFDMNRLPAVVVPEQRASVPRSVRASAPRIVTPSAFTAETAPRPPVQLSDGDWRVLESLCAEHGFGLGRSLDDGWFFDAIECWGPRTCFMERDVTHDQRAKLRLRWDDGYTVEYGCWSDRYACKDRWERFVELPDARRRAEAVWDDLAETPTPVDSEEDSEEDVEDAPKKKAGTDEARAGTTQLADAESAHDTAKKRVKEARKVVSANRALGVDTRGAEIQLEMELQTMHDTGKQLKALTAARPRRMVKGGLGEALVDDFRQRFVDDPEFRQRKEFAWLDVHEWVQEQKLDGADCSPLVSLLLPVLDAYWKLVVPTEGMNVVLSKRPVTREALVKGDEDVETQEWMWRPQDKFVGQVASHMSIGGLNLGDAWLAQPTLVRWRGADWQPLLSVSVFPRGWLDLWPGLAYSAERVDRLGDASDGGDGRRFEEFVVFVLGRTENQGSPAWKEFVALEPREFALDEGEWEQRRARIVGELPGSSCSTAWRWRTRGRAGCGAFW